MRVAFINRLAGIHQGGGEIYDLNLAAALRRAGVDLGFITGRPLIREGREISRELDVSFVRTPYLRGIAHQLGRAGWRLFDQDLRWFERAAEEVLAEMSPQPDLVQVTGLPDMAGRLEKDRGMKVVLLFPGPPDRRHLETVRRARHVVGVGAVTPFLKENFKDEITDMTAGVDLERFRPGGPSLRRQLAIPDGARVILFAGRLVPLKNVPGLIQVFAGVRRLLPGTILLVAGDGPVLGEMEAAAGRLGLGIGRDGSEDRPIIHLPDLAHDQMPSCYATADLLLLTSVNESFSLVTLEAMACKVPVVAPRVGYLPRLVEHGSWGYLYEPSDTAEAARACVDLLEAGGRRTAMGEAGRAAAEARHSWDAVAAEYLAYYEKVLAS